MEETPSGWTIIDKDAAVLSRVYQFAPGARSTAFVCKLQDGTLLVCSPPTDLTDDVAAELETYGEVGAVMTGNGFHHLGQKAWRERYPEARYFAPPEAAARIKKKGGDFAFEPLADLMPLLDDSVRVREVPNTKCGEAWISADIKEGRAIYTSDVLMNIPELPKGPIKLLFWATNSAPGYKVFNLALKFVVKDKKATLRLLADDLEANPATMVVPAHGAILDGPKIQEETLALLRSSL